MEMVADARGDNGDAPRALPHTCPTSKQVGYHNHSEGSFLDGFSKVAQMARRAKELGQEAIAITDHGEVNQHLAFQKACLAEGVKLYMMSSPAEMSPTTAAGLLTLFVDTLMHQARLQGNTAPK